MPQVGQRSYFLAIDAGNTQTALGVYEVDAGSFDEPRDISLDPSAGLVGHWRIATDAERTADELALLVKGFLSTVGLDMESTGWGLEGMIVSSVVPKVTVELRRLATRYLDVAPVVVNSQLDTGLKIEYDNPRDVGADRIANAVAAHHLYRDTTVVVDFGTATTIDAVSADATYLGGSILPGVQISLDALFEHAAALSRVDLSPLPTSVIGKTTAASIRSGALFGFAEQIDGLCRRFKEELGHASFVATGGMSSLIVPLSKEVEDEQPLLTLHGLRLIFERVAVTSGGARQ